MRIKEVTVIQKKGAGEKHVDFTVVFYFGQQYPCQATSLDTQNVHKKAHPINAKLYTTGPLR
jgi:hypothetical protein